MAQFGLSCHEQRRLNQLPNIYSDWPVNYSHYMSAVSHKEHWSGNKECLVTFTLKGKSSDVNKQYMYHNL